MVSKTHSDARYDADTLRSLCLDRLSRAGDGPIEEEETERLALDRRPLFLLGAGSSAAAPLVRAVLARFDVRRLVDNPRVGKYLFGRVCGDDTAFLEAAGTIPDLLAVICCGGEPAVDHFRALAAQAGVPVIGPELAMRRIASPYLDLGGQETVRTLVARENELAAFDDAESRRCFWAVLLHRLTLHLDWLDQVRLPMASMYFHDAFAWGSEEVLVDGGAYTGGIARALIAHLSGTYRHLHCFEPDSGNAATLSAWANGHDGVSVWEAALWSDSTVLSFAAEGNMGSRIHDAGQVTVRALALDHCDLGAVSWFKLDVEGAEAEALDGAARTIRAHHPKLAIAAYHRPFDLLDLPARIRALWPGYRLALRHHGPITSDTIVYAW